jgi:hypothetical protein
VATSLGGGVDLHGAGHARVVRVLLIYPRGSGLCSLYASCYDSDSF